MTKTKNSSGCSHEKAISVAINDLSTPFLCVMDEDNSLVESEWGSRLWASGGHFTFSKVSRPVCTILSAISTAGILPENVALVYPYVTLAMYLSPSCLASKIRDQRVVT